MVTVDKQNFRLALIVVFFAGALLGILAYDRFLVPDFETKTETITEIKYVDREVALPFKEFVFVEIPKPIFLTDTVIKEVNYPVNKYNGVTRTIYGTVDYNITTAGHLLDYNFKPNFSTTISTPVKTITNNRTITIKPRGIYALGSINNKFVPSIGVAYLDNRFLFGYTFNTNLGHNLTVGYKIF